MPDMVPGETKLIPMDRILLKNPTHVCIVVKDVEKTAALYSSLFGVGPFTVRLMHSAPPFAVVGGKPAEYKIKFGYCKTPTIMIELAETVEGHTAYQDFLERHGEGIHHIGFSASPPLDQELERWKKAGIEPLQVNRRDDPRYGWAYMDTQGLVGCIIEVVCDPALGWWESLALARDLKGPLGNA